MISRTTWALNLDVHFRRLVFLNPPTEHDIHLSCLSKVWGSLLYSSLLTFFLFPGRDRQTYTSRI